MNTTTNNLISNNCLPKRVSFDWQAIAKLVNGKSLGKSYGAYYIRDVALGYRTNSKVEGILERMGISTPIQKSTRAV